MRHRDGDGALRKGSPGTHGKVPLQQKRLRLFPQPWLAVLPGVSYVPASQMVVSIDPSHRTPVELLPIVTRPLAVASSHSRGREGEAAMLHLGLGWTSSHHWHQCIPAVGPA